MIFSFLAATPSLVIALSGLVYSSSEGGVLNIVWMSVRRVHDPLAFHNMPENVSTPRASLPLLTLRGGGSASRENCDVCGP